LIKSPLLIGNDLTKMSNETLNILGNAEVIAFNQDPLGVAGQRVAASRVLANGMQVSVANSDVIVDVCVPGDNRQKWTKLGNNKFKDANGDCLDIDDCNTDPNGAHVSSYLCHDEADSNANAACKGLNQQWVINTNGTITSVLDGYCLGVKSATAKSEIEVKPCNGSPAQQWKVNADTTIVNADGRCLTMDEATPSGSFEVWAGPLSGGDVAVILFNRSLQPGNVTALWTDIGLRPGQNAAVRDLWAKAPLGVFRDRFTASVPPHASMTLRLTPQ